MKRFIYADWLLHNEAVAEKDRNAFNKWEEGLWTTYRCYNTFLSNNFVIDRRAYDDYDQDEFVKWLNFLGYYRGDENET